MNNESKRMTVAELAALAGGRVVGSGDARVLIERVASLEGADSGAISFVEEQKFLEAARASRASCLLVPEGTGETASGEFAATLIEVARPKLAFALIAEVLHAPARRAGAIHPTAVVAETARIEEDVYIGACARVGERVRIGRGTQVLSGVVLEEGVEVGAECVLHPNVVLYAGVRLGSRVVLHAGVVVGADGFGYVRDAAGYHKFPQVGTVSIEDDVEIGANSCVDRGALGETRIGRGTKLDNLVHVGHNVEIGERVVIAAQTGISGSTVIESDAVIGGQVGMGDHARVQAGAVVGSKAGILPGKIVRAGAVVWGVPVRPLDEYKRLNAHFGRLPQMRAEIDELKRQVRELSARLPEKPDAETRKEE
ncbi:MAG TPA: UDP-3-O-(3-hydroxymyristoyl)glucosamine N-acyltransferase [Pyrinomonadaceae bacterium]|nr:UDP-3-O-(3-hydroxymyristoyl)glucosamine N-acyltransferase [Pyrinomonadaceae bacterium]